MKKTILVLAVGGLMAANALALDFRLINGDAYKNSNIQCPDGYAVAVHERLSDSVSRDKACRILGDWYIVRTADGGSMDGIGCGGWRYCKTRPRDDRELGQTLCVRESVAFQRERCSTASSRVDHSAAVNLVPGVCDLARDGSPIVVLADGLIDVRRGGDGDYCSVSLRQTLNPYLDEIVNAADTFDYFAQRPGVTTDSMPLS